MQELSNHGCPDTRATVEGVNLGELQEPLLRMIEELRTHGRVTAKKNYNCRGWVIHHNTDLWPGTAVVDNFAARLGDGTVAEQMLDRHMRGHVNGETRTIRSEENSQP